MKVETASKGRAYNEAPGAAVDRRCGTVGQIEKEPLDAFKEGAREFSMVSDSNAIYARLD